MKEVLLMSTVEGLGAEGDVVSVADGYARNYLLPQNLAAPVNVATRRRLEKTRSERSVREEKTRSDAQGLIAMIESASCTIAVKVGEGGKMFGSVTNADIAKVLAEQGIRIDRHQIQLDEALRETGVFTVNIKLHPDLVVPLKLWVVEE